MQSKYNKLIKNTALFTIGELGSKVLSFIIVPMYTYFLTPEQYGQIDLFSTVIQFLIPLLTLQIQEAMIRFLLGKEIDPQTAASNCLFVFLLGAVLGIAMYPIYMLYYKSNYMAVTFTVLLVLSAFNLIFSHYLKSIGKTAEYAAKGVLTTFITLALNVLFLVVFRLGMMGYFLSWILSAIFGAVYLLFVGKLWKMMTLRSLNFISLKKMIRFSVPLIPNSLMWWIMSAGDKYIINFFLGDGANGIYSLAQKIPTILNLFYSMFFQAWQMSAIEENESGSRKQFYENVFKMTSALLALLSAGIILFTKPFYTLVMEKSFASAWYYVPLLTIALIFSCHSSLFGVVYTTSKNTKKVFSTTAIGAVVNLILNFALIRPLGLQGVAIGTSIGYLVMCLIRMRDTKKEIDMNFDLLRSFLTLTVLVAQSILTISGINILIVGSGVSSIIILIILYRNEIMDLCGMFLRILHIKH